MSFSGDIPGTLGVHYGKYWRKLPEVDAVFRWTSVIHSLLGTNPGNVA